MKKIINFVGNNWLLLFILFIGLFFRIYKAVDYFSYGHEQDLQAWIVKDILVDHHLRLIGQETSITGLFIGPLYYYILAFFFLVTGLNPASSIIPVTFISLATIASVYIVGLKLFGKVTGTIASFIYAMSLNIVFLDRWAVPTQTTLLWTVWFFYVTISFVRESLKHLPVLIILFALIWHIHIALLPFFLVIPVAFLLSGKSVSKAVKKINKNELFFSIVISFFLLLPLILFEVRHGYQQITGLANSFSVEKGVITGIYKLQIILENVSRVLSEAIIYNLPHKLPLIYIVPSFFVIFLVILVFLFKKNVLKLKELLIFVLWLFLVISSHYFAKYAITEYYFNNLIVISVMIFSLFLSYLFCQKILQKPIIILAILFFLFNFKGLLSKPIPKGEFVDKNAAVEFIVKDYVKNGFSCVGINYIGPLGVAYGYRYLFWKNNIKLVAPGNDIPVYSIVNPYLISEKEIAENFGDIGVILPRNTKSNVSVCNDASRQLLPLNGFVN